MRKLAFLAVVAVAAVGCKPRFQGAEGFVSATTPVDYAKERAKPDSWKGDPYAFGGIADANGGLKSQTSYGLGAKATASENVDVRMNQPAKGIGQNTGDFPAYADPSHGNSNAPFAQPPAGAVGTTTNP